jgi:hypothetical protein
MQVFPLFQKALARINPRKLAQKSHETGKTGEIGTSMKALARYNSI